MIDLQVQPVHSEFKKWSSLVVLTLAVVMLAVDGTVLSLAVPALAADLGPTSTQLLWIGDIYSFALAGLLITAGNVADRIGRKRLLMIGSVGFGIASVMAAFASSPEMLIAARALLGVSGGTIMPSTLSIVRNLFDDRAQRAKAIAVWSAGATGGAAAGPLIGGALLEHFWWGSVFLINVPVIAIMLVAGAILLPESRNPARPRIDVVSALLVSAALIPLVYAVKHVVGYGLDASVIATAVVGAGAGYLFVRRQKRLTHPMIDVNLFRVPAFSGAVLANTISIFAFVGLLFFFSQYLQLVLGYTPLQAGLVELPSAIASIAVIAVIGTVQRLGTGRAIALGLMVAGAGLVVLALTRHIDGFLLMGAAFVLVGLGTGVAMTLSTDAVVGAVPKERAGSASAVAETAYELGVAFGIAILGSLQTALYRGMLELPAAVAEGDRRLVEESLASAQNVEGQSTELGSAIMEAAREAFTGGVQVTSLVAAALLTIAALIAWRFIPANRTATEVEH